MARARFTRTRVNLRRRTRGKRYGRRRYRGSLVQPRSITRILPTAFYNAIDAGAGSISYFILNGNSAYDPTGTASASLQGMGMDQYEALYNRYCVIGFKLRIEAVSTDNTNPVTFGATAMTSNTAKTSYLHYLELPYTVHKVLTPDRDRDTITLSVNCKKLLMPPGGKILSDDTATALVNYDPNRVIYIHVWAQAQDNTADPASIKFTCKITQTVVFYDRKQPSRSTQ